MPTIYAPSSIPLRIPFAPNRRFNFVKPIRVRNRTTKLTNYQIEVDLNTSNFAFDKVQSNGADIRFQDANGRSLPYWIESWTSTSATVWVKLNDLEAYEDRIIWLIYGNSNAISESSESTTFIQYHGSATATYLDALVTEENQDLYYRSKFKISNTAHNIVIGISNTIDLTDDHLIIQSYSIGYYRKVASGNDGSDSSCQESPDIGDDTYHIAEIKFLSGTEEKGWVSGNQIGTSNTTNLPNESMGLHLLKVSGFVTQDWSFIAKYTSPEPLVEIL